MKAMPWITLACAVTIAAHIGIAQHNRIKTLETHVQLSEQARKIESDQVRDLMYALREQKSQDQQVAMQSFIAGVLDTMERKPDYERIWHAGYDRGTEVQTMMMEVKPKPEPKPLPPK